MLKHNFGWLCQFIFSPAAYESSRCSTPSCSYFPPHLLNFSHSGGCVLISHWVFIFTSLNTFGFEHLIFHVHWPFGDPLMLFCVFPIFLLGCLFFLWINRNSLHILLVIHKVNSFPIQLLVYFLFSSLMTFAEQKFFFNVVQFIHFFSLWWMLFVTRLRNLCLSQDQE